jgi:hypothetical protein
VFDGVWRGGEGEILLDGSIGLVDTVKICDGHKRGLVWGIN